MQSDSGKGPPLPNQSTYLIHLSQGWGLISYIWDKTRGNIRVVGERKKKLRCKEIEGKVRTRDLRTKNSRGYQYLYISYF